MAGHVGRKFRIEFFAIPNSEAFFSFLRLFGVHPIIWHQRSFVASGRVFTIVVLLSLCFHLTALSDGFLENLAIVSRKDNDAIPVRREIDFFLYALHMSSITLLGLHMVILDRKRKAIAATFNELNLLWNLVDRPRPATLNLVWTVVPLTLFLISFCLYRSVLSWDTQSASGWAVSLTRSLHFLGSVVCFETILASSTMFSLMIFVYGVLIGAADVIYRVLDGSVRSCDPNKYDLLRGMLRLYLSTLEKFSSVISPLISVGYLQAFCVTVRALFFTVIPISEESEPLAWAIPGYVMTHHILCLVLSNAVTKKIKMLRFRLQTHWYADQLPKRLFQEFDLILERIPHPASALFFFELNLGVIIAVASYLVDYFMVFVQFKAILVGTGYKSTSSSRRRTRS